MLTALVKFIAWYKIPSISILLTNLAVKRKNLGKTWQNWATNLGLLGEKQECFLCATQPPPPTFRLIHLYPRLQLIVKRLNDAEFATTIHSEKFGTIAIEEKFTDDGVHIVRNL